MRQRSRTARIVLDTSAYVAALLSKGGGAAAIFERVLSGQCINFCTEDVLAELREVLRRPKFRLNPDVQARFMQIVRESSQEIAPSAAFQCARCRDPRDDKFLSLSLQAEADFLVTLDQDLLVLQKVGRTRILTPGECLSVANNLSRSPPRS